MSTDIKTIKQKMIDEVIARLGKFGYMPNTDRELYLNTIKEKLNDRLLVTTVRTQSGITNADDYNKTAFETYLDLLTTFDYVDELFSTINNHQKLNESIVNTLYSTIGEIDDRLEEYAASISSEGVPHVFYENFRTQANQSWDRKYYTERYGERMPLATFVKFNPEQENITLNYTRQQNVMVYKSGVQLGEISLTKQYGSGFIKARNSEAKLENCIDTSMTSYWADTILSDSEIKIKGLGYENTDGLGQTNRSYYDATRGAMCEICLTFEALAKVNEIILRPFGTYPIDIIAIRYSLTDDEDDTTYDIVYPDNRYEWLRSESINHEYSYHFHEIVCKKLYILINQVHFIKDTYMIESNKMFKNELWFNSTWSDTANVKMEDTAVFQACYLDRGQEDAVWRYVNNKIVTNKSIDINDLLIKNKNKLLPVTKYQYTYGFYNIAPNFVEFQKAGIYVSNEIVVDGAIDCVSLISDELHFETSDGHIATDIEFYITTKANPQYTDWKPICPKNKDYVYHEFMQLDYDYCYLRHEAVCGNIAVYKDVKNDDGTQLVAVESMEMERPIVYYNDIVLTEDADYILRYNELGNVYAIEIANIDHFAIYTVSYTPVDSSKELSLVGDSSDPVPNSTFEEIMGNGTACYELEGFPYYNNRKPDESLSYLKIINTDTNTILSQTARATSPIVCVTNRSNPADSYKNFIANSNKIQYYTYGRKVYFSKPISANQKIEITYPSLDSKIRVKAILRRNSKRDMWLTPVLKSYKVEMTTL